MKGRNMLYIKNLFILILFVGAFSFKSNHFDLRPSEVLLQLFKECRKGNETIVIIDDSGQLDLMWLQQLYQQFYSFILLKGNLQNKKSHFDYKKIDAILITMSTYQKYQKILNRFHATSWWSSMIPVYVLHLPINSCDFANEILRLAWKKKILTSYFFCKQNKVQIYTSNPFINEAPSVWKKVRSDLNWTLYRHLYPEINCQGFQFDRTRNLNEFLLNARSKSFQIDNNITFNYLAHRSLILLELLSISLHINYKFRVDTAVYALINSSNYKSYRQEKKKIYKTNITEKVTPDLIIDNCYLQSEIKVPKGLYVLTYPLAWYENGIAVKNRGYRTIGEKLWNFYGIWTVLFTIFILITTFIVIWFIHDRNIVFAVFETIRLLISHNLHTPMNTLFLRIFFLSALMYFLIIQATFNGHLAKFLTKLEQRKLPETEEDLRDLGYTSIQDGSKSSYRLNSRIQKSPRRYKSKECMEIILHEDFTACIYDHTLLLHHQQDLKAYTKLYISKNPIETQYVGFRISKYHPLADRVNRAFMALEDFGFRQWLSKYEVDSTLTRNTSITIKVKSDNYFCPIKLEHLTFNFWILAIGLSSATCSFFVEMLMSRKERLLNFLNCIGTRVPKKNNGHLSKRNK